MHLRKVNQFEWGQRVVYAHRKEASSMGKTTIPILILVLLVLVVPPKLNAAIVVVDFHENGVIQEGDAYTRVNVRHDAMVIMTGGYVHSIVQYESSTVTVIGGSVDDFTLDGSSTASLYGGDFGILIAPFQSTSFHIYGYGFTRADTPGYGRLTGLWPDGTPFELRLMAAEAWADHYVLHEVPEPATMMLVGSGILMVRTRYRQSRYYRRT